MIGASAAPAFRGLFDDTLGRSKVALPRGRYRIRPAPRQATFSVGFAAAVRLRKAQYGTVRRFSISLN
jgi:hypothetical protein